MDAASTSCRCSSATFLAFLRIPPAAPAAHATFFADLAVGWHDLASRRWYWVSLIAHAFCNFGMAFLFVLEPVIVARQPGGPGSWGLIGVALSAGSLTGTAILLGRRLRRPLLVGNRLLTLLELPLVLLAAAASSAGLAVLSDAWNSTMQHLIPAEIMARMSAYDWLISLAITSAGYAAASPIADALGRQGPRSSSPQR